jgi:Ni/Co efflux regulator RcnB
MRKGLWIAAAVALLGSSLVMAQDQPKQPAPGARPPAHRPAPHRPAAARPPYGPRPPHRFLSGGGWHHSIRGPAFVYPPGFAYQSWTTGSILPPIFLTAPYFYDGYATLGLSPPPAGYRWVRYGPDVILVNVSTGRVADVVDGVFY